MDCIMRDQWGTPYRVTGGVALEKGQPARAIMRINEIGAVYKIGPLYYMVDLAEGIARLGFTVH